MQRLNTVFLLVIISHVCASGQNVNIVAAPTEDAPIISKHIYGHFAEHLGRCIYEGLYVGDDSPIPNTYHWKDGIGPKAERPTIVNQWWGGGTEDNSFGTHDFLNLCELLEAGIIPL